MQGVGTIQLAVERDDFYSGDLRESGAAQPTHGCVSDVKPGIDDDITPGPAEDVVSVAKWTKLNRGIFLPVNIHKAALVAHIMDTRRVFMRLKDRIELRR